MATDKRERQRANREARQEEEKKARRKRRFIDRSRRIAIWTVVILGLILISSWLWGGQSTDATTTTIESITFLTPA